MGRWPNKNVIGLTGNLAMGKSLVRRMLEHLGAYTIDADGLAYQAMAPGGPAYKPAIQTFGMWILDAEKRINRAKLEAVSFSHPEALRRKQAITQRIVGPAIDTLIGRVKHEVIVVEATDLLEGAFADAVDAIWVVDCSPENQLARLTKSGLSEWEARNRIDLQNPQQAKLDRANVVINNDGTPEQVWTAVQAEWGRLGQEEREEHATTIMVQAQPVTAAAPTTDVAQLELTEVTIKRGGPKNAEEIAGLLSALTAKEVTRMDVMMAFGQKSYLVAEGGGQNLGLVGFQVENLITRVDEFLIKPGAILPPVVAGFIDAVEEASSDLQSEVGFFFVPADLPQVLTEVFEAKGYETRKVDEIKVPAWREAARESWPDDTILYARKLRAERVLKPL